MYIIGVFGNRDITDENKIMSKFYAHFGDESEEFLILHGGAQGPQQVLSNRFNSILFKPWHMVWSKIEFTPILFYMRNKQIVDNADDIVIFTNGEKDAEVYKVVELCEKKGIDFTLLDMTQ